MIWRMRDGGWSRAENQELSTLTKCTLHQKHGWQQRRLWLQLKLLENAWCSWVLLADYLGFREMIYYYLLRIVLLRIFFTAVFLST
jgi:hypothetical protein